MAQWLANLTRNHGVVGSIPGLARWVGIRRCHGLWCRLLMQLGSPYCCGCGVGRRRLQLRFDPWPGNLHMPRERPKKWQKEKKKKRRERDKKNHKRGVPLWCSGLRIQHCHSSSWGHSSGSRFSPWPGNFHMLQVQPKKKKKEEDSEKDSHFYRCL